MCAMLLPLALTGCGDKGTSEKIIEKPDVKVVNGMMTPEVLESFGRIGDPQPSPDGSKIIFTLTYEDIEENKGNAEIYVMDADGRNMKRLTKTAGSEGNIRWYANGEKIAFLAKDKETDAVQIYRMNADGSNVKRLTEMKNGIECFSIAPDEKHIVFSSPIDAFDKDSTLFEGLPKTTGRVVDDLMYKHWDEWVTQIPHPFVADFDNDGIKNEADIMVGEPFECPMRPFGGAESFVWAPTVSRWFMSAAS